MSIADLTAIEFAVNRARRTRRKSLSLCARRPSNVKASEGCFKFAVFFICCVLQVLYIFLQIPFWH